jgi:ATP-binding cassette subfamily G (WHITE) protein 2 (PDR)
MSIFVFVSWYYPIGMYRNAKPTDSVAERGGAMFLLIWVYFMYSSTFSHMIQAGIELAEMAGNYANLLFTFSLIFCGILATPAAMPGFWIFMYRVSPFTYLVGAILAVGLSDASVRCSGVELQHFDPTPGNTCSSYMSPYINENGGYLVNPEATSKCSFCLIGDTNTFLKSIGVDLENRWRNLGLLWVYVAVNIVGAITLYWLVRVPKKPKRAVWEVWRPQVQ